MRERESALSHSRALHGQNRQQRELEIVQAVAFSQREPERVAGPGDARDVVECGPVHLIDQRPADPHVRRDHAQDVAAPLQRHLRCVQAAVVLQDAAEPVQHAVIFVNGAMVVVGLIEQRTPCVLAVPCLQHRIAGGEVV